MLSALIPDGPITRDGRSSFCCFVNFFPPKEAAKRWALTQAGKQFRILPVQRAFEWVKEYDRATFNNA